jgi:hypothetical protein
MVRRSPLWRVAPAVASIRFSDVLSAVRHDGALPAATAATAATAVQGVWPTLQATAPADTVHGAGGGPESDWRKPGRRLATAGARRRERHAWKLACT